MNIYVKELYPKVFKSNSKQTLYVSFEHDETIDCSLLKIKIQPMEKYSVLHSEKYRIDEEERYSYVRLKHIESDIFAVEYEFSAEQQYSVKIKYDDKFVCCTYIYSLNDDLARLNIFKGDTHLHTCRSDGEGTPFEVACNYRAAGYDFITITDHHKFEPSLEAQEQIKELTNDFFVFSGEEVHNKDMGYFHIINMGGESSVNDIIETDDNYVETEIKKILSTRDFTGISDPRCVAYRIFVAEHIKKGNGLAIMAHPFWEAYGEYHMQTEEFIYHWQNGDFDALEVLAGCDGTGNGNNLQEMLRSDMLSQGYKIPVVGSSDAHTTVNKHSTDLFNKQFTLVFAKDFNDITKAIKCEQSVAVERTDDSKYRVVGKFRYAKYARFLMREYYFSYSNLCLEHANALKNKNIALVKESEDKIYKFKSKFFNI
ncbi:MAG: PHP domain-containing protein [Clostridia bacterium]|nr:PHP domain-containing protein [Clostridia bacterium]